MKTLADIKNKNQARKIEQAARDLARGISEKDRDMMLHTIDIANYCSGGGSLLSSDVMREYRRRFLRSIY